MKHYKITYWLNGNILIAYTDAADATAARYNFEMYVPNDDVISIEEVGEQN